MDCWEYDFKETGQKIKKKAGRLAEIPTHHSQQPPPGTGGVYQLNDHLWEGKYSPRDAHGKRISRNVYAKTQEECEDKLAALIKEMKKQIVAEKEKSRNK